ncbi:isocitrate dehydrogenase [Ignicoccus islandicus DSM 13165]|uniref:Isocitrate dehydrogenase (NADP(+)) n=1 Tax=Ignicoccus islandicus DSM 13165 TaxID=940295 RepID=A0A0U2VCL5_9CREN|nr:NADP-dependent isocitrate dehydrogenase [Ignicoccus islandicus]ALU11810.1 isocitrate dehydrogenase [Ignicoccus islandicus DSM 13165]
MFQKIKPPEGGEFIKVEGGKLVVPPNPIVPYIEGDGIGPEVVNAARKMVDAAVETSYKGERKIVWWKVYAGIEAEPIYGTLLPEDTLNAIKTARVALKGPMTTPIGSGWRSVNVALRQLLDLYANIRPVKYIKGIPAPHKYADKVDIIIFRENTEDVYAGIEWKYDSPEAAKIREFLKKEFNIQLREDSGIGLKPISRFATRRIMRAALNWAIEYNRKRVTVMHKGNIMKYTEGYFKIWAFELAKEEFGDKVVFEEELQGGEVPEGKILVNDRIADNMFNQIITRPWDYDVIVTPNLNGDYLSDAAAALVGGLGIAPGANVGDNIGMFEPIHGSAPKYAGKNVANPTATALSAAIMLDYIGWHEAADLLRKGIEETIASHKVTQDIARHLGIEPLSTTEFTEEVIKNIKRLGT